MVWTYCGLTHLLMSTDIPGQWNLLEMPSRVLVWPVCAPIRLSWPLYSLCFWLCLYIASSIALLLNGSNKQLDLQDMIYITSIDYLYQDIFLAIIMLLSHLSNTLYIQQEVLNILSSYIYSCYGCKVLVLSTPLHLFDNLATFQTNHNHDPISYIALIND